jgi:hypothetical protein
MWFEHLTSSVLNRFLIQPPPAQSPGLLLGQTVEPPHRSVLLPDRQRCQHAVILGKTGSGKTYLLESLAWQLAQRGEGFAFLDFHGDASLSLISRLLEVPGAAQRLVIVDPSHPTRSPGLNVLDAGHTEAERFRKVSELSAILRQRWGVEAFGARTEELLRNSLYTLAASHLTLADLPRLLADSRLRMQLVDRLEHPEVVAYWQQRYQPLSEAMKAAFREPLLNKVTGFLTEPAARHLLGQRESTVDVPAVIRNRQWLIIRLPKGRLREAAHTLGNLLFAQLQFAALAREALPHSQRHTFTLLCDEAQNLAENDLNTLLTEGRKFGIAVITANQFWEQLPRELRGALLSANAHLCFRVSNADAQVLAGELSPQQRSRLAVELTSLSLGEAIGRVGTHHVVRFRVPALPTVRPIRSAELDALIAPVTRDRGEIERELRAVTAPAADEPIQRAPMASTEEGQHGW